MITDIRKYTVATLSDAGVDPLMEAARVIELNATFIKEDLKGWLKVATCRRINAIRVLDMHEIEKWNAVIASIC